MLSRKGAKVAVAADHPQAPRRETGVLSSSNPLPNHVTRFSRMSAAIALMWRWA